MDAASLLILLSFVGFLEANVCPYTSYIEPCECVSHSEKLYIECTDVRPANKLITPMRVIAKSKREVMELSINNTSLLDSPDNLFTNISIRQVKFLNAQMTSLSESKADFYGLENSSLELITAERSEFPSGLHFEQFRNFKGLLEMTFNRCNMQGAINTLPLLPSLWRLKVTGSGISTISSVAFRNLPDLVVLTLNHNRITEMRRSMFPNPSLKLRKIDLSTNLLSSLPPDFHENMMDLSYIDLRNNRFKNIFRQPFLGLTRRMSEINMSGNPIHCDSSLNWLGDIRIIRKFHGTCSSPEAHYGKSVRKVYFK